MGNLPSCVECMEDDAFPRVPVNPDNNGAMCDSVSMKALPPNSTNGGTMKALIPFTKETTEDIVQISVTKPLGVTLCDSESTEGVFVTAIKPEGNVAKLTQPVSVGMLLMELNGVDVTKETLGNVIKKISDAPVEKRLILKFSGTKPVEKAVATDTAVVTTTSATTTATAAKESVPDQKDQASATKKDEVLKEGSVTSNATSSQKQGDDKSEVVTKTPEDKIDLEDEKKEEEDKDKEEEKESGSEGKESTVTHKGTEKHEGDTWNNVPTPEKEETFGEFTTAGPPDSNDSIESSQSMDTVDITPSPTPQATPNPTTRTVDSTDDVSHLDLDDSEFSNVSLHDNGDESCSVSSVSDDEEQKEDKETTAQEQQITETTPSSSSAPPKGELLKCSHCDTDLPRDSFSATQLKKKAKRKCKGCNK